jgi:hypothetical protein
VDGNARHAIAVAEIGDKCAGLFGHRDYARIAEQPRVARDLDQDLLQALRQTETSARFALPGDDRPRPIEIVDDIGAGRAAAKREQRRQVPDRGGNSQSASHAVPHLRGPSGRYPISSIA